MSTSQSRVDANRENAQHSTGPKTEEGKKISCLNALRNGFNSPVDVLPHEDMQAYLGLGQELNETWQPKGPYEHRLVQTLTSQHWRLQRCASIENAMFALGHAAFGDKIPEPDDAATARAQADPRDPHRRSLIHSFSRREVRINRIYQTTLKELKEVQAIRGERERIELIRAAALYKTAKMNDLPYDPADDAFTHASVGSF